MAIGFRSGRFRAGRGVRCARDHHSHLVILEWVAKAEAVLRERFMMGLVLVRVQLDELWAKVRDGANEQALNEEFLGHLQRKNKACV